MSRSANGNLKVNLYWRRNLLVLVLLLLAWALVGLGCGILWADWLNRYSFFGYPLGFWFAQQGSIVAFVLIILSYCLWMNRLDAAHPPEQPGSENPRPPATPGSAE